MKMEKFESVDGAIVNKEGLKDFLFEFKNEPVSIYYLDDNFIKPRFYIDFRLKTASKIESKPEMFLKGRRTATANKVMEENNIKRKKYHICLVDRNKEILIEFRAIRLKRQFYYVNWRREIEGEEKIEGMVDRSFEKFYEELSDLPLG